MPVEVLVFHFDVEDYRKLLTKRFPGVIFHIFHHTEEAGHVVADRWMGTGKPGLFVAGSIRSDAPGLALTAAADGAVAALAAHRYLSGQSA